MSVVDVLLLCVSHSFTHMLQNSSPVQMDVKVTIPPLQTASLHNQVLAQQLASRPSVVAALQNRSVKLIFFLTPHCDLHYFCIDSGRVFLHWMPFLTERMMHWFVHRDVHWLSLSSEILWWLVCVFCLQDLKQRLGKKNVKNRLGRNAVRGNHGGAIRLFRKSIGQGTYVRDSPQNGE